MLEKEIRAEIVNLKQKLQDERKKLGQTPLNARESAKWKKFLDALAVDDVKQINKKINDYNLIVPLLNKQMVHVNLIRMSDTCLRDSPSKFDVPKTPKIDHDHVSKPSDSGLFGLFGSLWKSI